MDGGHAAPASELRGRQAEDEALKGPSLVGKEINPLIKDVGEILILHVS